MNKDLLLKEFHKYVNSQAIETVIMKIVSVIFIILCMYITIKVGNRIIRKIAKTQNNFRISLDEKRTKTLESLLCSILRYTVYFIGIGAIISVFINHFGVTFAGIGGVAIGLGAQSLIKDVLNGVFILFEQQYVVGDHVTIGDKSGIVESLELRVTKIRDFNGDLHIVPNSMITNVTNHSRGDMRVAVDLDIAYDEDIDNAINVIKDSLEDFKKTNEEMVEGPDVAGAVSFTGRGVCIRVVGKAKPMTQWQCETELRTFLKKELDKKGIRFAQSLIDYSNADKGEDR